MASWGVHPTVNAVCFVRNEGEGLRWSTRCSERACKWADAMARAGKGDKYVSKGDYPACKKKPSLRVLAAADAIRKANPNSSATRSQFRNSSYRLPSGRKHHYLCPTGTPCIPSVLLSRTSIPSRGWFEHTTQPLKKSFLCETNFLVRRRLPPC